MFLEYKRFCTFYKNFKLINMVLIDLHTIYFFWEITIQRYLFKCICFYSFFICYISTFTHTYTHTHTCKYVTLIQTCPNFIVLISSFTPLTLLRFHKKIYMYICMFVGCQFRKFDPGIFQSIPKLFKNFLYFTFFLIKTN